jgi:hypothetical protein
MPGVAQRRAFVGVRRDYQDLALLRGGNQARA